jgi:hypothetical protein
MDARPPSRTRYGRPLSLIGLLVLLITPALLLRAARPRPADTPEHSTRFEAFLRKEEARRIRGAGQPPMFAPVPERAPFGRSIAPSHLTGTKAMGKIPTTWGHVAWDEGDDGLAARFPAGFRLRSDDGAGDRPGRRLARGLNYVGLSAAAIEARGLDEVMRELASLGRTVGVLRQSTLVVYLEASQIRAVLHSAIIDATRPVAPYEKIATDYGVRYELSRNEAANPNVRARITFVPGEGSIDVVTRIGAIAGATEVLGGRSSDSITARLSTAALQRIARMPEVMRIDPIRDVMTANAVSVSSLQMGSAEDGMLMRPFDAAGVDGGGIDTSGDGRRINDGSDAVPPQIVTVTDNGISLDTPNFSQTATEVVGISPSVPIGPSHRKVHAIQAIEDDGSGCDAPLSGAGTHGNVVAAVIAAYPSELGFFATRSGTGGAGEPRHENLDGVARGARILVQDVAGPGLCTINSLVERGGNLNPGNLIDRMNEAICPSSGGIGACTGVAGGDDVHLAVLPFGIPNFSERLTVVDPPYAQEAADLDTFLYNNRDFMIVMPVGNNGATINDGPSSSWSPAIPDLFDGSDLNDDLNTPRPIQTSPPATAKNVITVGSSTADCFTAFGTTDCEGINSHFSSRGPATAQSLRMAPMIVAPGFDLTGTPLTAGVAVFRSRDNDNLAPVEAHLDEGNTGTSFAAAYVTGAAAVLRDYFAQGFYPSGDRDEADRVPNLSGALIKAALAASADFNESGSGSSTAAGANAEDLLLLRTRARDLGAPVGIVGNSEQGYGRAVLTHVLPLANWPDRFALHPDSGAPREYPAAGLLVWDHLATGEAPIDNTTTIATSHSFTVTSPTITTTSSGGTAVTTAQLRIALAWIDLPSPAGSGGPLTNDLDLVLEGPGPDNCLEPSDTTPDGSPCPAGSADDNLFYDGNRYGDGDAESDQWSLGRDAASPAVHDQRNPVEAIHLGGDPDNDDSFVDSPLYVGRWRVTVQRGTGGAIPGAITILGPDEDANGNHRLDPGEDGNLNGLLDLPGQPYGLVVAGPVFIAEAPPPLGPSSFPQSTLSLDRSRYDCADDLHLTILDTTAGSSPAQSFASTMFSMIDAGGTVVDTEAGIGFVAGTAPGETVSAALPIRLAAPAIAGNGALEGDTGDTIVAAYAPPGQRAMKARAEVRCTPDLVDGSFIAEGSGAVGSQVSIGGGCDDDDYLDAGEVVTYGVALLNRSRSDGFVDVMASLTPSGPGAAAVRVLDSPQDLGRLPEGGASGVFFQIFVDPSIADALPVFDRKVTLILTLDSVARGARLQRQSFSFMHALNSDREEKFYSTDHPAGGREIRDLNRNLLIDAPDRIDPALGFVVPPEDVTFSSMFVPTGAGGLVSNTLGEDLDDDGELDPGEADIIPNGIVDGGILALPGGPSAGDHVPWNFDTDGGGFVPLRHPGTVQGTLTGIPLWERTGTGICGFQTALPDGDPADWFQNDGAGIWHTGDGDTATPDLIAAACDPHPQPIDAATPPQTEMVFDVVMSPIIAKVNQQNDARGFPYTVEFQRLGINLNMRFADGYSERYAGGGINIDNDVEDDDVNSILGQPTDQYAARRFGGWPNSLFQFPGKYFRQYVSYYGTVRDFYVPTSAERRFGSLNNPDAIPLPAITGDETGFTGRTAAPFSAEPLICDPGAGFCSRYGYCSTDPGPDRHCVVNADCALCASPTAMAGMRCETDTDCDPGIISPADDEFLPSPLPGEPAPGLCEGGINRGQLCQVASEATDCPGSSCSEGSNTVAGPVRNYDATLIGYEGGFARVVSRYSAFAPRGVYADPVTGPNFLPGTAGDRWQIAIGFWAIESMTGAIDYGVGFDDLVFEWKEHHPEDEATLGHPPACQRFGGAGQPAGGQCAVLTVDRTHLYECNESITITLFDAKCVVVGAGNTAPLGAARRRGGDRDRQRRDDGQSSRNRGADAEREALHARRGAGRAGAVRGKRDLLDHDRRRQSCLHDPGKRYRVRCLLRGSVV